MAYEIEVRYLNGKKIFLADTLSRPYIPRSSGDTQEEFETINALTYLVLSERRIQEIRQYINSDPALQQLKKAIQEGWPEDKSQRHPLVKPYFSFHDELAVTDGLVFRGKRPVIPKGMRSQIKKDVHDGHQGISESPNSGSE